MTRLNSGSSGRCQNRLSDPVDSERLVVNTEDSCSVCFVSYPASCMQVVPLAQTIYGISNVCLNTSDMDNLLMCAACVNIQR